MNFIITKDIDGNEILLNLENVSAIEQYKEDRGKTKYFIRQFRPSASIEISAEEFEKFKSIVKLTAVKIVDCELPPYDIPAPESITETTQKAFAPAEDFAPKTVKIGDQIWMNKNLAIDDGGDGITINQETGEHYYTWDAAKRVVEKIKGWHLPTIAEWDFLAANAGGCEVCGNKLKAASGWDDNGNGTDDFGFSALPAGYYNGSFRNLGSYAYFWTATEYNSSIAYFRNFNTGASVNSNNYSKNYQYSVRLVKDSE
jgi:uncharacterized protein (TIGR02145 family)